MDVLTRAIAVRETMVAWLAETEEKLSAIEEFAAPNERIRGREVPVRAPKKPRNGASEPSEIAEENQKANFCANMHRTLMKLVQVAAGGRLETKHLMVTHRTEKGVRRVFPAWFRAFVLFGVQPDLVSYTVTMKSPFAAAILSADDFQSLRGHYSERWDGKSLIRLFEKYGKDGLRLREDVREMVKNDLALLWSMMP